MMVMFFWHVYMYTQLWKIKCGENKAELVWLYLQISFLCIELLDLCNATVLVEAFQTLISERESCLSYVKQLDEA